MTARSNPSVAPLSAQGERVLIRTVQEGDLASYALAVERSRPRLARWNPVDPSDLRRHLLAQSDLHRTFLVHALEPQGGHDLVGKINVANVVYGRFRSAHLGYDAYDPYAGQGMFREGLALVVTLAFAATEDGGMGLHRVEANVQPGNLRSAMLLRSLGFRHEGASPRLLWLGGPDGVEDWRDHERFAMTSDEWPAAPFSRPVRRRVVVLVNGPSSAEKASLAADLADELGLPLVNPEDGEPWSLVARCPQGAVVDGVWSVQHTEEVLDRLRRADAPPMGLVEVRVEPAGSTDVELGSVLRVDLSAPVGPDEVVRLALAARAAAR